ncbi:N-acetylornithine carbamoyltransferase [Robertkochia aurantiaca]|uniref:N-acetylornithine carbamoyltransferase n=1 Tax=Robertkochia aurantiaca TaxID=2873700 RepID=UPI001CCCEA83|nr:N-acetylornithine carbamoyltransferase [Robertkochia sp. 3YJGBD-33]
MKQFHDLNDITEIDLLLDRARSFKRDPFQKESLGKHKTLGMLFFNASLRTRMSTQKAARNLGMDVMVLNLDSDSWKMEFEDGTRMHTDKAEHIREAAAVIGQYADLLAIRAFPTLSDREADRAEKILKGFAAYAGVPVINMESATAHPLQALADALTITDTMEQLKTKKPKIVLSWAPHPKALPHAVPNSFVKMMKQLEMDLTITHPEGYDLDPGITAGVTINKNQDEALEQADFVYAKNWSSYRDYGKVLSTDASWMITKEKLGNARFMHCLPVRRNVVVEDAVLDSDQSLVIEQAGNRTWVAQAVLEAILGRGEW